MAAPKITAVFSRPFSTILTACRIDEQITRIDTVLDDAEWDEQFKQTHGVARKDWDAALSLPLRGDLR